MPCNLTKAWREYHTGRDTSSGFYAHVCMWIMILSYLRCDKGCMGFAVIEEV